MKRFPFWLCLAAGLAAACSDQTSPRTPRPSFSISDGHGTGNAHFFFLPPILPVPSTSGIVNPSLSPAVQICQVVASSEPGTGCAGSAEVAFFTTTTGPGGETVRVDAANQYGVNWHTDQFNLSDALNYRIRVLLGSAELGFADVDVMPTAKGAKNVDTGVFIALVDGRTLPIRFRIENAVFPLCTDPTLDCVQQTVGAAAADVVTPSRRAAVHFDAGSFDENVQVVIEQVVTDEKTRCNRTDLAEFDDCYNYRTVPEVEDFNGNLARVEVCLSVPKGDALSELLQLGQSDVDEVFSLLEPAFNALIDCPGYPSTEPPSEIIGVRGWRGVFRGVASLVAPRRLYAAVLTNTGLGGSTGSFSNIGWVLPRILRLVNPITSAPAGSTIDVTVDLETLHPVAAGAGDVAVTFTVTTGGKLNGGSDFVTVSTMPGTGTATVRWTINSGTNTLMISAPQVMESPLTYTVTGETIGVIGD